MSLLRPKFNPKTPKIVMRPFKFYDLTFKPGDDFDPKKAKASERQLKGLYNSRRIKDKLVAAEAPAKPPKKTEAEVLAEAQESLRLEEEAKAAKEAAAKAVQEQQEAEDAQKEADRLAEDAKVAQEKADKEKAEADEAKEAVKKPTKSKAKKAPAKKPTTTKPAAKDKKPWESSPEG